MFIVLTKIFSQENALRYFPNINSKYLSNISQTSEEDFTVVGCDDILYYLDQTKFKKFSPKVPIEDAIIYHVEAFSRKNIWVFYENFPYDYYTRCYHFNGVKWITIHLPQKERLQYFVFLDLHKFIASGMWGSLIYYNGKKAINIKTVPYSYGGVLKAFSKNKFFIAVRPEEPLFNNVLYEVTNNTYKKKFISESEIIHLKFSNPQNGYIFAQNGKIYKYKNGIVSLFDSIKITDQINSFHKSIYYSNNQGIWKYDFKKKIRICNNNNKFNLVYPINDKGYFLVKNNTRLFYYGNKKLGKEIHQKRTEFKNVTYSYQTTGDLGIGLYRNAKNRVLAYFTAWEDVNHFYELNPNYNIIQPPLDLTDKLNQSGLLGYGSNRIVGNKHKLPEIKYDVGMFFNDLDNDGDADAIMTAFRGGGKIYENIGDDKFLDVTKDCNFELNGRTKNIFFDDLNNDGWVDIIAGVSAQPLHIWLNKGYWRFENKTNTGIIPDSLIGFIPTFADVDNDGDRDLFLYSGYDHIYYFENQTKKEKIKFVDKSYLSPELTTKFDFFPHWLAFGDYDNDGDLDLFLANRVTPIKLFENNGSGVFTDISTKIPKRSFLSYSANWGDFDQDGYQDLFLATVGKNYILWNNESEYFELDSLCFQENPNGLTVGSVVNDIDNDGDLDIIFTNSEFGYSQILMNLSNKKNYILFRFLFTNSVGTKIWLYEKNGNKPQSLAGYREIKLSQGYYSSGLPEVQFGVDSLKQYSAVIEYPSGYEQKIDKIIPGRIYEYSEPRDQIAQLKSTLSSYVLNPQKKIVFWNLVVVISLLIILSFLAFQKYRWKAVNFLFYYTLLALVTFVLFYLLRNNNTWLKTYITLYGTLSLSVVIFYLINRYNNLYNRETRHFELFDLLRQYNHSKSGIKFIDHILLFANNPKFENPEWENKFRNELTFFNEHSFPLLTRINNLYERLYYNNKFGKILIQSKKYINKIFNGKNITKKMVSSLQKNLTELKKSLRKVKNEVEKEYKTELMSNLSFIVSNFSQSGELKIENNLTEKEIYVVIREEDLVQVINNLIQNAMEAMKEVDRKKLDIIIEKKSVALISLKVRDYGIGLPHVKGEPWFKEHYTTKNSSGLGLYHAKKILNSFGCEIKLEKPNDGPGTVATITLRIYYENNHSDD